MRTSAHPPLGVAQFSSAWVGSGEGAVMARSCCRVVAGLGVLLGAWLSQSRADVFVLTQGGQVAGDLQNPEQSPREQYVIKTPEGTLVTLARAQVKQVQRPKPEEIEYEKIRSQYPDTADGQWQLAEWCKDRKLTAARTAHLQRVVELDPNHEPARRALGQTKLDGKWTTQRDFLANQGLRFYRGKLRTQQEIDILEEEHRSKVTEREWTQKIERLAGWLTTDRVDEARDELLKLRDPKAAKGLALVMKNNPNPDVRIVMAQALGGLNTSQTLLFLAARAVDDPVEEVRLTCLEILKKTKNPEVVEYFVGRLRDRKSGNAEINRAGAALRIMGDPSAVGPLIDSLITIHRIKVNNSNPGQTSATFGSGGGGMAVGGGPKYMPVPFKNPAVLDALVALTGQAGFEWDVPAWRKWFAAQRNRESPDIRRDK